MQAETKPQTPASLRARSTVNCSGYYAEQNRLVSVLHHREPHPKFLAAGQAQNVFCRFGSH